MFLRGACGRARIKRTTVCSRYDDFSSGLVERNALSMLISGFPLPWHILLVFDNGSSQAKGMRLHEGST
jgi:hypothetical protein